MTEADENAGKTPAEDSAHALASSGAQKSSEAVYLSLVDMEIERLDSCIAVKILHFKDRKLSLFLLVGLIFSMNIEHNYICPW